MHYSNKHPKFYDTVQQAINSYNSVIETDKIVLVLNKIKGPTTSQSDYYIQYAVSC